MQTEITALINIIEEAHPQLTQIEESVFEKRPAPGKWSKKEILGHLIDSAQTNIRRFVVGRYENNPTILYEQNFWVEAGGYQTYTLADLIQLWVLLNKHLAHVWKLISETDWQKLCTTGEPHTLAWLAQDYNLHLLHHLQVILNRPQFADV
jgi:hypothetical protein